MGQGQQERYYKLRELLGGGRCLSPAELTRRFEVSLATLKRDIRHLRDRMNAPIAWDRERGGWVLDTAQNQLGTQYELPGFWLSAQEIHALLTMQHLLANLEPGGWLGSQVDPLMKRLARALDGGLPESAEVVRRIRVLTVGARHVELPHFQAIGSALLRRRRLVIAYHARSQDRSSEREISPQRLVHYRDNWYLDAWCHLRQALRSFSVDAVKAVRILDRPSLDVPDDELDDVLGAGYGIFAGKHVKWASLRFSADRARWVAAERWHPDQDGRFDDDGRWLLTVPYADHRELVMDILRHLPGVEVLGPPALAQEVRERVTEALRRWADG